MHIGFTCSLMDCLKVDVVDVATGAIGKHANKGRLLAVEDGGLPVILLAMVAAW